ncbi:unnamed protein product [Brachionus calyciflorus]|uniref:Uncharacterized protein n=1 Tax=Brachionus calyciflorus TaxID=104777 RepID=A0A813YYB5_9BILA|nr:unnamed protein product [Brachionus calyciflorus]
MGDRKKPTPYDIDYKVLIIGESRVGKTSIIKRLNNEGFSESTISTVGLDFVNAFFNIDGVTVRLQIWDTAGQERFRTITRSHFRNTKGTVLVYDISDRESFEKLEYWVDNLSNMNLDREVVYIIGNKNDLESEREISYEQGQKFASRNLVKFFETSAKNGNNLQEIFKTLAFDILDSNDMSKMNRYKYKSMSECFVYSYNMPNEIQLKQPNENAKKKNKFLLPFKKKLKYKAPVAKSLDNLNQISYNTSNDTNKIKLKSDKKSNKKNSKNKKKKSLRYLNCCKIS